MTTLSFPASTGDRSVEVSARSSAARWMLSFTGLVGYALLGFVALIPVGALVQVRYPATLAFPIVPGVIAAVRGAMVKAAVTPDGIYLRNRWRQQLIPWSRVRSVDESASAGYTILLSLRALFHFGRAFGGSGDMTDVYYVRYGSSLLSVHVEGHRVGIPLYATIGHPMAPHQEPFRRALAEAGFPVNPIIASSDEVAPAVDGLGTGSSVPPPPFVPPHSPHSPWSPPPAG